MIGRRSTLGLLGGLAVGTALGASVGCTSRTGSTGAELSSQLPLPQPFTVPLPIPATRSPQDGALTLTARVAEAEILPGRTTTIWGYDGSFPGPTLRLQSRRPTSLTLTNHLDVATVLHLHGGRTPARHDGYPTDLIAAGGQRRYEYPLEQRAATLWYHDHAMDFTGPNVYAGLAGLALLDDPADDRLGLPRDSREVPLVICDRAFDGDAQFRYPLAHPDRSHPGVEEKFHGGVLGDCVLVNGAPWPVMEVDAVRHRFRLLNASNARRYDLRLDHGLQFVQIGTDQGFVHAPQRRSHLTLAAGERADVVVDFAAVATGEVVVMRNALADGGPGQVMAFRVVRRARDDSRVPSTLASIDDLSSRVSITRDLHFSLGLRNEHHGGMPMWSVNGTTFHDGDLFTARLGTVERWRLSSDVHHPVHSHLFAFQVTSDGQRTWKDTVDLLPGSGAEVIVPIDGYAGRYVLHCHNLEHEDMMMMVNFRVE